MPIVGTKVNFRAKNQIKPDNILIGGQENNQLFLIDLGLAKKYRNKSEHIPYRRHGMVGTVRYASINTHREISQS